MSQYSSESTICVHAGTQIDPHTQGVITPVYPSTSYAYLNREVKTYPRYFNILNHRALVEKLSALEQSESGMIFSSGMAAISTTLISLLSKGDHLVVQHGLYGGTSNFIRKELPRMGVDFSYAASKEASDIAAMIRPETRVIYIETPSNPLLTITDIEAVAKLAKRHNIVTVIDNTFASPINQKPLNLGIDVSLHSATKYLGGHSDICAGAVLASQELIDTIGSSAENLGGSLNAETCSLLERSLKTLAIRVRQQNENAQALAEFLHHHPRINRVNYPGLASHAGHAIAKEQMNGFGGMLSFELADDIDPIDFQQRLKMIHPSMSLGGVESTICSSFLTSHVYLSKEERLAEGIRDSLLRLSVGIEGVDDLIRDIEGAL